MLDRTFRMASALEEAFDDGPDAAAEHLAHLLQLELFVFYSLAEQDRRLHIDLASERGGGRLVERFEEYLCGAERRFGHFDPLRPEPDQRNRSFRLEQLGAPSPLMRDMYPRLGLVGLRQIRVIVCDGAAMLGWLGGWRSGLEIRDAELHTLDALVPTLRRRLRLMRWTGRANFGLAALRAALDAMSGPAFVCGQRGEILEANAAGRALFDQDPRDVRARLALAMRDRLPGSHVTSLRARDVPPRWLVVLPADATARVASCARTWGLSPRQEEVLGHIMAGHANKTIAASLGCSVRNVEQHVSQLLARAQVSSRGELAATIWRSRS